MMAQLVEAGKLTRDHLRALEAAVDRYENQLTHDRTESRALRDRQGVRERKRRGAVK